MKNFTTISNSILDREDLSLEALALYIRIKRHISKKGWEIRRESVKRESGLGETVFRRIWKELQEAGLLISKRVRNLKGAFSFEFSLAKEEQGTSKKSNVKSKQPKKEKANSEEVKVPVDSNGNIPLEGQVHADELLESAANELQSNELNSIDPKEIELVSTETGLENEKAEQLLKLAGIERILEVYKYSKCRAKNLFKFMFKAIKDNWDTTEIYVPVSEDDNGITSFGNYTSNNSKRLKNKTFTEEEIRKFKELENDLLGWYK